MRSWPPAARSTGRSRGFAPRRWWKAPASITVPTRWGVVRLDAHGDGNGGPKVVWKFDMIEEVGASPHNMANSSPVSYGNLLFAGTANGQDESHVHIPSPRAPSMIALNKNT